MKAHIEIIRREDEPVYTFAGGGHSEPSTFVTRSPGLAEGTIYGRDGYKSSFTVSLTAKETELLNELSALIEARVAREILTEAE